MFIVAGLGNPGRQYQDNRHNIGFMAVDAIARAHSFGPWSKKFKSEIAEGSIGDEKVLLMKPQTFMNLSGDAVGEADEARVGELGGLGLALLMLPFVYYGWKGMIRARAPAPDRWIVVAALGSLLVIFLTALTLDFRFFSIAQMLPFLFLAVLRRTVSVPPAQA